MMEDVLLCQSELSIQIILPNQIIWDKLENFHCDPICIYQINLKNGSL